MKRSFIILFFTIVFSTTTLFANKFPQTQEVKKADTIVIDSSRYVRQNGILVPINGWTPLDNGVSFKDTMFYRPMFLPVVFDGQVLPYNLNFLDKTNTSNTPIAPNFHLISPENTFSPIIHQSIWAHGVRKDYFLNNMASMKYNVFSMKGIKSIDDQDVISPSELTHGIHGELSNIKTKVDIEKFVPEQIYWTKEGEHSLQINQNQFSNNWYAGGYNNLSVLNYHKLVFNYKKNKISWNNTLEWKLNFQRTPADTLHKTSISEDYLRAYSVVGVSLNKRWSYTLSNEVKTPLFKSYKVNSTTQKAALFSPLVVNSGIGLTYNFTHTSKADKYRKLTLSMDLSPFSMNYIYVSDNAVDGSSFGVDAGKKSKLDLGSTYNLNLTYSYNRNSTLTSRLKYFTSYSKVIVESENKFNFAFTRLLSSTLYLYLRYDDGVGASNKDAKLGYFQYNELVGFGLTYKW